MRDMALIKLFIQSDEEVVLEKEDILELASIFQNRSMRKFLTLMDQEVNGVAAQFAQIDLTRTGEEGVRRICNLQGKNEGLNRWFDEIESILAKEESDEA